MEVLEEQKSVDESNLELVEFHVDPIIGHLAEVLLESISGDKLFLTRVDEVDLESKVIKKDTPLFSFLNHENIEEDEQNEKLTLRIDPSFKYEKSNIVQSGKDYVTSTDGMLILVNDKPIIIPVSLDGSCDVKVSEDSMSIILDIYPSIGENSITTYEDIEAKILKMGVKSTIKEDILNEKLSEVEREKKKFLDVCIVEGEKEVNGKDGWLENKTKKREKISNLNFDDFYKVNPVISVKENDVIGIVHPPTEGEDGHDVFGNRLAPKPGRKCSISLGANTSYSEEDRSNILAKKDGFLNLLDSSISISDTFTVRGNIDFESGNIVAKGSLKVQGNVQNDFSLKLTKEVEIGGYVGDAKIEAGENIVVRGGFLGKGKGIIKSEADVEIKFVENQRVYSRGSLYLTKDTLNAKLFVKEKIISKTKRTSIIGGHAIAGDFIDIYSAGNDARTETLLEVGFDYLKKNSIVEKKERQSELRLQLEEVDKHILEFAKMKRRNPQAQEKLVQLANLHKKIEAEINNLKEQNIKTTNEIYVPTDAKISISGTIFPGVKIGINGRFYTVDQIMKAKTFILSDDNEVIAV